MGLDGANGEDELLGDLLIRVSQREKADHLTLATRQRVVGDVRPPSHVSCDDSSAQNRVYVTIPSGHGPHCGEHGGFPCSLEDIATGTGSERLADGTGIVARGHHERLAVGKLGENATNRLDCPGRCDSVQHDDVRRLGAPLDDRLESILRFSDHLDVVVLGEYVSKPDPGNRIARDDQGPDAQRRARGANASTMTAATPPSAIASSAALAQSSGVSRVFVIAAQPYATVRTH